MKRKTTFLSSLIWLVLLLSVVYPQEYAQSCFSNQPYKISPIYPSI